MTNSCTPAHLSKWLHEQCIMCMVTYSFVSQTKLGNFDMLLLVLFIKKWYLWTLSPFQPMFQEHLGVLKCLFFTQIDVFFVIEDRFVPLSDTVVLTFEAIQIIYRGCSDLSSAEWDALSNTKGGFALWRSEVGVQYRWVMLEFHWWRSHPPKAWQSSVPAQHCMSSSLMSPSESCTGEGQWVSVGVGLLGWRAELCQAIKSNKHRDEEEEFAADLCIIQREETTKKGT